MVHAGMGMATRTSPCGGSAPAYEERGEVPLLGRGTAVTVAGLVTATLGTVWDELVQTEQMMPRLAERRVQSEWSDGTVKGQQGHSCDKAAYQAAHDTTAWIRIRGQLGIRRPRRANEGALQQDALHVGDGDSVDAGSSAEDEVSLHGYAVANARHVDGCVDGRGGEWLWAQQTGTQTYNCKAVVQRGQRAPLRHRTRTECGLMAGSGRQGRVPGLIRAERDGSLKMSGVAARVLMIAVAVDVEMLKESNGNCLGKASLGKNVGMAAKIIRAREIFERKKKDELSEVDGMPDVEPCWMDECTYEEYDKGQQSAKGGHDPSPRGRVALGTRPIAIPLLCTSLFPIYPAVAVPWKAFSQASIPDLPIWIRASFCKVKLTLERETEEMSIPWKRERWSDVNGEAEYGNKNRGAHYWIIGPKVLEIICMKECRKLVGIRYRLVWR
ncbi:hypothetical protein F5148DRAFT_1155215 [Russula earlei]|uniref:Uncharacterized protein n=1 Tax=Russula earlei TaxID=71964 RepID=A0ACC0TQ40_9AGAM|nr:hypothetical protein F5148DRAFT_1155215 [Russula earlei]